MTKFSKVLKSHNIKIVNTKSAINQIKKKQKQINNQDLLVFKELKFNKTLKVQFEKKNVNWEQLSSTAGL